VTRFADHRLGQGSVGIDRDYDSLRQDLWIATDQGLQASRRDVLTQTVLPEQPGASIQYSTIFSKAQPIQQIEPLATPDWAIAIGSKKRRLALPATLRLFPDIYEFSRQPTIWFTPPNTC